MAEYKTTFTFKSPKIHKMEIEAFKSLCDAMTERILLDFSKRLNQDEQS